MSAFNLSPAAQLVADLRRRGVTLSADGDKLNLKAPKNTITAADGAAITAHKSEILALLAGEAASEITIPRRDRGSELPLGATQRHMWVHDHMLPDSLLNHLPAAWVLDGELDVAALDRAFAAFLARHEVMRSRIEVSNGIPSQRFDDHSAFRLETEDLADLPPQQRDARLRQRVHELRDAPFDLSDGIPFRSRLFRSGPTRHVLFFMPHHIVWDGWSFDIFLDEIGQLYQSEVSGEAISLPDLPVQYFDYAHWLDRRAESGRLEPQLAYWQRVLDGELPSLDLPFDKPRPRIFSYAGDWIEFTLSAETVAQVGRLANEHRATPFMVMLAIWYAFLARVCGQSDLVVGAPIQTRHHHDVGNLVGAFGSTICLRQNVDVATPFTSLIEAVRSDCLAAYEHQDVPLGMLIERVVKRRDPSRPPLFQAMFTHQQVARRPDTFGELGLSQYHVNPLSTPSELMFAVMEGAQGARAVIHYSTDLFDRKTVGRLRQRLEAFIATILEQPTSRIRDLPILTEPEREQVLVTWNATARDYARETLSHDAFAARARQTPDAVAVVCNGREISYQALDEQSGRLAGYLASLGAGPGEIIAIHQERSIDLVTIMLAIWKCGAAYLPLDPAFPLDRLAYMLEDSGAKIVVSQSQLADQRPQSSARFVEIDRIGDAIASATPLSRVELGADQRAYVLYTSGSTGKPKGVEVAHRSLVNFIESMAREPGISASDRLLAVTTLSFDISLLELMVPLSVGGTVVLATRDDAIDGYALVDLIEDHDITVMQAVPASWRLLIEAEWEGKPDLKALCGGEALPAALAETLLGLTGELWNMYGPTETTIWSTCTRVLEPERITVGRPIANTQTYILDDDGTPQPPGIGGELWIAGDGVAIGYLGNPELTAERFRPDPFSSVPGARMYRTGDWARFLDDGSIEFQRRRDNQVKVRGFRIELGEIETQLAAHPSIAQNVVIVREDVVGDTRIAAYLVLKPGTAATGSEIRRWLRQSLPDYMVPHLVVELEALPLTNNGKIDRQALPAPVAVRSEEAVVAEPKTEIEIAIADVWRDLLGVQQVSVTDNFFDLGGQSLQAAQMVARVMKKCGHRIAPRSVIFETLEQLAQSP